MASTTRAAIYNAFVPGSAGTTGDRGLEPRGKRRCPAAALVHIEGAWNHGEKTREPTSPRLADAQRAVAARWRNRNFVHRGTCYQKTGWFEPHPPPAEHQRLAEQIATAWNAIDAARRAKAGVRERTVDAAATRRVQCECRTRQLFGDNRDRERREGREVVPTRR